MRLSICVVALMFALFAGNTLAAEAIPLGKLPDGVTPLHYELKLKIDPRTPQFSGTARIRVRLEAATNHIWLHAKKLHVVRAQLTDATGAHYNVRFVTRDPSGVAEVEIGSMIPAQVVDLSLDYVAPFNGESEGLYVVAIGTDRYAVSQMEAISARYAFPGFDEPRFKTPFDITLTVHKADLAFTNTREMREDVSRDGKWKTVTYAPTKPLPTYLVAFAVGPWDVAQAPAIPPNGVRATPVELRGIGTRGSAAQMKWVLEQTPAIVDYYEQYTQQPYPFDKLDLLGVPSFAAGGMENAGLIIFDDSLLRFGDSSAASAYVDGYETVAHEISHQWFGDLVTMLWWDDLWLNEGFANWAQFKATIALKPEYLAEMERAEETLGAMGADSLVTARKIRQPIGNADDIENAFDSITYQKGAALLRMTESWVGESIFRDALRKYLAERAFASGSTDDLLATVAAASGKGDAVSKSMRSFLDQPGAPLIRFERACNDGKATFSLSQSRYLPFGATSAGDSLWNVPVCVRAGHENPSARQCFLLEKSKQEFAAGAACAEAYSPNADADGYYRSTLNDEGLAAQAKGFPHLNPLEQDYYVQSLSSTFGRGDLGPSALLNAMPPLARSDYPQIAMGLDSWFTWIRMNLADANTRPALDAFASKMYAPRIEALGYRHRPGDTLGTSTLRNGIAEFLAETIRNKAVQAVLAGQGRDALGIGGKGTIDLTRAEADLRRLALQAAVQEDGEPAFDAVVRELKTNRDTLQRTQLLSALGSTRDPKLGMRARDYAMTAIPGEMLTVFSAQTAQPENRDAFGEWFRQRFDAIRARLPDESGLVDLVSMDQCSDAEADALAQWFAPRIKKLVGGERTLAQALERIRECSALRKHIDAGDLSAWVSAQAPH